MKRELEEQSTPSYDEQDDVVDVEEIEAEESPQEPKKEEESLKQQLLRLRADFDNFRKRTIVEKQQLSKYALEPIAFDILDAMDDMERALNSPEHGDEEWRKGVEMIYRKIMVALEKNGVKTIGAKGQPFDPHLHEALTAHTSLDVECDTVADEVLKGYLLHDRVIRHTKVVVATPEAECESTTEDENNTNEIEGDE